MQGTESETTNYLNGDTSTATELHEQLLQRGQKLLQDLEQLQAKAAGAKGLVDVSKFVREVRHELNLITKDGHLRGEYDEGSRNKDEHAVASVSDVVNGNTVPRQSMDDRVPPDSRLHRLRSSNLSFYEKIWDMAQKQEDITAIRKLVAWRPLRLVRENGHVSVVKSQRREKKKVMVDIMCEGGRKWIKVWTRTQKNLIMDMAKEGIVGYDMDSEQEDGTSMISDDATNDLQLVKLARSLVQAAKTVRLDFQHPTVIMMLPNVLEGEVADVDRVLEVVREQGAIVKCVNSIEKDQWSATEATSLREALQQSTVVNVDCTILVALVSDISHYRRDDVQVPKHYQDSAARDIEEQLASEVDKPLLPSNLYPKLAGKQLVCSDEAAKHLRSIIRVMGSETEKQRAALLLGDARDEGRPSLHDAFAALSVHDLPDSLQMPVTLVEATSESCIEACSDRMQRAVMLELATKEWFSSLNQAVVFHGWLSDLHTMTINRSIARRVRKSIDDVLDQLELEGQVNSTELRSFRAPKFVICGRQRSLLGSEKIS